MNVLLSKITKILVKADMSVPTTRRPTRDVRSTLPRNSNYFKRNIIKARLLFAKVHRDK